MKPLKAAASFVIGLAACYAGLFVFVAPFNWFTGQNPEKRVGNYLIQGGNGGGDVHVIDCRPARESPTAEKPSALFDCAMEAEEPVELELEGGGFVHLDEGQQLSLCFAVPSAKKPRSFLPPEPARLVRVGRCPA
jgi:hypothetical protein